MPSLAIVPAAGKGERFGGGKLLADVGGTTLLDRTIRCLLSGGVHQVVVVLPPGGRFDAVTALTDSRVAVTSNPDPSRGMLSSIQAGLGVASGDPILVLPGDMPFVASGSVVAVLMMQAQTGGVVVPTYQKKGGHPVGLPAKLRDAILRAPATSTLSHVLHANGVHRMECPVDDPGILRDVDVRADLS